LTLHTLWPIPHKALRRAVTSYVRRALVPELNMGLYAGALREAMPTVKIESIIRCDGNQFDPHAIARRITEWPCG
jgi:pyruvate/2-oxoacid:ferredoxin oxidoreductase alpha subunit